ncbi:hypothetical protein EDC04DRAFT_2787070, partial [Pisolithus marmoratus]
MNRFTQFDEDSYRLPEGVERIEYDADTQRYLFRDRSGQLYQNEPGDHYGVLQPVKYPIPPRRRVTIIGKMCISWIIGLVSIQPT